jgi:hypothetical protein
MPIPVALQALAYVLTAASAVKSLTQDPPENKLSSTAQAAGGAPGQAEQIFTTGQPQPKAPALPGAVQAPMDPNVTAATNALTMQQSTSPVGQAIVDNAIQGAPGLNVPNSPLMPTPQQQQGSMTMEDFFSGMNNVGGALATMAPLLGLGQKDQRGIRTAGAAGGQGGQNIFQLPQRNTLAQILASLPRAYNG